ncbi:hypothetical protein EYC80_000575 [Monilinia laxa]|uniref:Uncharacterized protein n=1 Tax=Monilinia laxa TaxID=61186 RepID=A0A5N6KB31_MONLA|nr:hypothetical protein EYC80_000575 [Monilinia laxa]
MIPLFLLLSYNTIPRYPTSPSTYKTNIKHPRLIFSLSNKSYSNTYNTIHYTTLHYTTHYTTLHTTNSRFEIKFHDIPTYLPTDFAFDCVKINPKHPLQDGILDT